MQSIFWYLTIHQVREKTEGIRCVADNHWFKGVKTVLSDSQIWINAAIAGLIYLPTAILGELWGPMYFEQIYGLSELESGRIYGWIFIGWGIGGALNGWCSDYLRLRRPT